MTILSCFPFPLNDPPYNTSKYIFSPYSSNMSFHLDSQLLDLVHSSKPLSKDVNRFLASSSVKDIRLAWAERRDHAPELELERVRLEQESDVLIAFIKNPKLTRKSYSYLLKSKNKSISILAGLSIKATPKDTQFMLKHISIPVFKKFVSLNMETLADFSLSQAGESLLLHYGELRILHKINFSSINLNELLKRVRSVNFDNSKGERNLVYLLLLIARNFSSNSELLTLINNRYNHPLLDVLIKGSYPQDKIPSKLKVDIEELTRYLSFDQILSLIPSLESIPFEVIYSNKNLSSNDYISLLLLYPKSIYTFITADIKTPLEVKDAIFIITYLLNDSEPNKILDLYHIFNLPILQDRDTFYQAIVDKNCFNNKRLAQYIAKSQDCSLQIALQLDAGISISAYHNQQELIEFMLKDMNYRDFEAFRVMASEFDGTINDLINIVRNFGFYE